MRRVLHLAIVAVLPVLVGFTWPGTVEWLCTRGVRQYEAGEFGEAGESFGRALEIEAGNSTLKYNRGTALYRQDRWQEAAEAFGAAAEAADEELARDGAYNLGNTLFRAGDFGAAIEAYKAALRLDPGDAQAKHNLELALQRQEEQQNQQQQDQQQDDREQPEQEQQPDQQENQQENQQDGQRDDQQQEQPQDDQQGDQGSRDQQAEQPSGGQQTEQGQLSEEQARRLLHALASQDAEMQDLIRRAPARRQATEGENDW